MNGPLLKPTSMIYSCLIFVLATALEADVEASIVVAQHTGNTDPTSEGFTFVGGGATNASVGAVNSGGTAAWQINDPFRQGGSAYYRQGVTLPASNDGWVLSATIQAPQVPFSLPFSNDPVSVLQSAVSFSDGTTLWAFGVQTTGFGSQPTSAIVQVVELLGVAVPGSAVPHSRAISTLGDNLQLANNNAPSTNGPFAFNTFDLVFDPNVGSADLFLNGVEIISDYAGVSNNVPSTFAAEEGFDFSGTANEVTFGSLSARDGGTTNFNSVIFRVNEISNPDPGVVPEPASFVVWLVIAGSVSLGRSKWQARSI